MEVLMTMNGVDDAWQGATNRPTNDRRRTAGNDEGREWGTVWMTNGGYQANEQQTTNSEDDEWQE
jgi:hypothetical protein